MNEGFFTNRTKGNIDMSAGTIESICISCRKGIVKKPVDEAEFRVDYGIEGDAHAGDWHRQISLLPKESIERVREEIPNLADGAFAENLITAGIDLGALQIGTQLRINDEVLLEVTQIGKECHTACAIQTLTGDCIMPREGIFCRVLHGGRVLPGMSIELLPQRHREHREHIKDVSR